MLSIQGREKVKTRINKKINLGPFLSKHPQYEHLNLISKYELLGFIVLNPKSQKYSAFAIRARNNNKIKQWYKFSPKKEVKQINNIDTFLASEQPVMLFYKKCE